MLANCNHRICSLAPGSASWSWLLGFISNIVQVGVGVGVGVTGVTKYFTLYSQYYIFRGVTSFGETVIPNTVDNVNR